MIDTHIHIVPGVDDGAQNIEMSLAMARMAIEQGITEMVVTPHYNVPLFDSPMINEQFEILRTALLEYKLPLRIHLANEIHVNAESLQGFHEGLGRTMGGGKFLLMELPFHQYYPYHESMLYDLQIQDYRILLAHIERYRVFRHDEMKLKALIDKGCYGQMNARYIVEKKTRKRALDWITKGYVHIVASDAHNTDRRPIMMGEAYCIIEAAFGKNSADTLFTSNPRRIIRDKKVLYVPERSKQSFWRKSFHWI